MNEGDLGCAIGACNIARRHVLLLGGSGIPATRARPPQIEVEIETGPALYHTALSKLDSSTLYWPKPVKEGRIINENKEK